MADWSEVLGPVLFGPSWPAFPGHNPVPPGMAGQLGLLARLAQWYPGDPCGPNQHLAALGSATRLTPPSDAQSALVTVSTAAVFLSLDGTDATATNGLNIAAGSLFRLTGRDSLNAASFLQVAAGAVVDVAYFT